MDAEDELEGEEFDPSIYDLCVVHVVKPPIPPRPSQAALEAAAQRTKQRKQFLRAKKPTVPCRRPYSQNPASIALRPSQASSSEQMEAAAFAKIIAKKLVAKQDTSSALVFRYVGNNPNQLWHMVISEFEHRFPNSIRCECASEEIYSHWRSNPNMPHAAYELYMYLSIVLVGEDANELIQRLLSSPFPKQTSEFPAHYLGKVCRFAVPAVFTAVMSREMDSLLQSKEMLTDSDWLHLLSVATHYTQEFITCMLSKFATLTQLFAHRETSFAVSSKPEFLIRERIQFAINGVFNLGLRMFYHEVFAAKDRAVASKLELLALEKPTFASLACKFGVKPSTAQTFDDDDMIAQVFTNALFTCTSPISQLDSLIQALELFSSGVFGGDDFLSMFISAVCFASIKQKPEDVKLATLANILDEFGLTEELKGGQGGYIVSCLLTTVEAISQL